MPDFDDAVRQLRAFLVRLGHPVGDLAWVFREDVSTHLRRVLVKVPLPAGNETLVRARYEEGRRLGVGVCLEVFCRLGTAYLCTCWFVLDEEESARRRCVGLKLCVADDLPAARSVGSALGWAVHRWLDARSGLRHLRDFLPSRGPAGTATGRTD